MARSAAMASSSCKVFNLDVSSSLSARTRKGGGGGGKEGEGVREEGGGWILIKGSDIFPYSTSTINKAARQF